VLPPPDSSSPDPQTPFSQRANLRAVARVRIVDKDEMLVFSFPEVESPPQPHLGEVIC